MPGFTNRVLARFVDSAAVTFRESLEYFHGRGRVTGNPVRGDFGNLKKKETHGDIAHPDIRWKPGRPRDKQRDGRGVASAWPLKR